MALDQTVQNHKHQTEKEHHKGIHLLGWLPLAGNIATTCVCMSKPRCSDDRHEDSKEPDMCMPRPPSPLQARKLQRVAADLLRRKREHLKRLAEAEAYLLPLPPTAANGTHAMQVLKAVSANLTLSAKIMFTPNADGVAVASPMDQLLQLGYFLTNSGVSGPFSVLLVNNCNHPLMCEVRPVSDQQLEDDTAGGASAGRPSAAAGGIGSSSDGSGLFSLLQQRLYLPAGQSTALELMLHAEGHAAGVHTQAFSISSEQLQQPVYITVSARLQDCEVVVSPAIVKFGDMSTMQSKLEVLHLTNKTNVPLR